MRTDLVLDAELSSSLSLRAEGGRSEHLPSQQGQVARSPTANCATEPEHLPKLCDLHHTHPNSARANLSIFPVPTPGLLTSLSILSTFRSSTYHVITYHVSGPTYPQSHRTCAPAPPFRTQVPFRHALARPVVSSAQLAHLLTYPHPALLHPSSLVVRLGCADLPDRHRRASLPATMSLKADLQYVQKVARGAGRSH